jgi:hypothetical protein
MPDLLETRPEIREQEDSIQMIRYVSLILMVTACTREAPKPPAGQAQPAPTPPAAVVPPAAPAAGAWVVTPAGIGAVKFGWTVAELNAALGEQLKPTYEVSTECDYVRPASFPQGVSLMVIKDTVMRVDVDTTGVPTGAGAGVGDTEARVLSLYGDRIKVEPHKYTGPEGHYLVVSPLNDPRFRIIFETDGKVVLSYRAGRVPAVEFVEGCA